MTRTELVARRTKTRTLLLRVVPMLKAELLPTMLQLVKLTLPTTPLLRVMLLPLKLKPLLGLMLPQEALPLPLTTLLFSLLSPMLFLVSKLAVSLLRTSPQPFRPSLTVVLLPVVPPPTLLLVLVAMLLLLLLLLVAMLLPVLKVMLLLVLITMLPQVARPEKLPQLKAMPLGVPKLVKLLVPPKVTRLPTLRRTTRRITRLMLNFRVF
jgi:hypothetical protein